MEVTDFDYDLPQELIAQTPVEPRDSSRLLVMDKKTGELEHRHFFNLPEYLKPGDVLVFNDTRVIPARLHGFKTTGAHVEVFLLTRKNATDWEVLVKPGKKLQKGAQIKFSDELSCEILETTDFGGRIARFHYDGIFEEILDRLGEHYELSHSDAQAQRIELESVPKANRRIGELKRDIAALGTPNIGAIEEYDRVNTRYTYLTDQRNDVEKAKGELETIIGEITAEMTRIFAEQFKLLSESFQTTFQELFGGGQAKLELEDEENILGCGIEIKAQPPGKTLKTISLLSGGEKAFVAIALYFAILKVHPTPFCVMDEIEAALDDANVTRYARYMRTLAGRTQFIVITHRRGTMEEADVLYGVTMQEQGVSKILTINLNDMAKELNIK